MIRMYCDRCKKENKGEVYYTVEIKSSFISCENLNLTYDLNVASNCRILNNKPQLCEECKKEIENFIKGENYECI